MWHKDDNGIPRDVQTRRLANGDVAVRIGDAYVGQGSSDNADGDDSGGLLSDEPGKSFTVRALRARPSEEPLLTPQEFLLKAHAYAGQGNGSVRGWLQAAVIGLGITTYVGYVISTDDTSNIEQLIMDLNDNQPVELVTMVSKQMDGLQPPVPGGAGLLKKSAGKQSGEGTYIIKNRAIVYVGSFGPTSFSCAFDWFHTDITEAERACFLRFHEREEAKKVQEDVQRIYMLVDYGNGDYNFHSNKIALSEFKKDNYSSENVNWMPRLKEGLFVPTSPGRLTILQGPPGTGKTRFLRALMQEMGEAAVPVVLPVSLAGELSHPRMLGQITSNDEFEGKNLLLIIEDGDALLEKRDHASSVISDFLNIVDGLVGEIVNLHVIVTTNLQKKDFDPAITRPGRLHSILYFESLPAAQAATIYKRETGEDLTTDKDKYTLAEVYALSINHVNGVREKKSIESGQYL
jgi:hypothetical protein